MPNESPTITIKIDGHPYTLRPKELSALELSIFQTETGVSFEALMTMLESPASAGGRTLVNVARFAYLCALQGGQNPSGFAEVAARITYGSAIENEVEAGDDETDEQADRIEAGEVGAEDPLADAGESSGGPSPDSPTTSD